jgi:DNA-binding NtrC family response regulator
MRILLVDDDRALVSSVVHLLTRQGATVVCTYNLAGAKAMLESVEALDLVISDYSIGPKEKGDVVLRTAMRLQPQARRILISGEEAAARFVESGEAQVFYLKDSQMVGSLVAEMEALSPEVPSL